MYDKAGLSMRRDSLILHNRMFQRVKRVMDVVCAGIGLIVLLRPFC